ncbi:MAG: hypothetical protein JW871_02485 [Endomicrobiales bacterium]|nr:hypothetical protein [Endomicrobiales bacterium]
MSRIYTSELHSKIVSITGEYGYITVDEIEMITKSKRKAYNVMQYLTSRGLVRTFKTMLYPTKAYYLPEHIRKQVESAGEGQYVCRFYPSTYKTTSFYHDTTLIKIQLATENFFNERLLEFTPEKRLKVENDKRLKFCDAEFTILSRNGPEKKFCIELELSLKNKETREKTIERLFEYSKDNFNAILYFYNRKIIKNKMIETIKELKKQKPHAFFINIDTYINNTELSKMEMINNKTFQIGDL